MSCEKVYYSDLFKKIANGQKAMLNHGGGPERHYLCTVAGTAISQ